MPTNHDAEQTLAIYGAPPAKQRPDPPMYPGGMAIGDEEEQAVLEVIRAKGSSASMDLAIRRRRSRRLKLPSPNSWERNTALQSPQVTASLTCGLHAIGVGLGDEVIVPAYTWIASAAAVISAGAIPVIAEVDATLTLDPADVEAKISPYTKAIMPVHMRGAPCRMDALINLARRHDLLVIEDTAQADGASYRGQRLGTFGDVGCFSLQFNKIITSGEGGMVVTNREETWKRALMYHDVIAPLRHGLPADELVSGHELPYAGIAGRSRVWYSCAGWMVCSTRCASANA